MTDDITKRDESYMKEALKEAEAARAAGEVPIGCVIVQSREDAGGASANAGGAAAGAHGVYEGAGGASEGVIIARGHNMTETLKDPTAHAEMIAIRQAAKALGGWRLPRCTMYVTCEPCSMCAGALICSRMERLVIGTMDPKAGACGSVFDIPHEQKLNHTISVTTGVLREECATILKDFFREIR